jgi:predicted TIM-barrel fold metal-dependent hydrolase
MELSVLHNKLNNGSIHPYVPFDPLRDVESDGQVYKDTIEYLQNYGAIGIKLYPPMGFRVYQNSELEFCHSNIENLGIKIDESLMKIYSYCHENEIPILVHTANSNYNLSCKDYVGRADPIYWDRVLEKFNNLRINMGHFAKHSLLGNMWSLTIRRLMLNYPNVYADFSHIERFDNEQYTNDFFYALNDFLNGGETGDRERLLTRFLYGSDWIMLAKERISKKYFLHLVERFDNEFGSQGDNAVRNNFIGGNAYKYLGLDHPKTIKRLITFYTINTIDKPNWLESV